MMSGEIGAILKIRRDAGGKGNEFLRNRRFGRQYDDDLALAMRDHVRIVEMAFAFGRAELARCQEPRQPAIRGAVLGKGEGARVLAKIEAAADDEADADFFRRLMRAHDPGKSVVVGYRDRLVTERRRGH